ncbi:MBL fold metallo-hydrolase [Jeongeupia sp. USM3]|uniref:MBL fold metallo-hydrolase n=1 Tax=Jeongeupia sp. USM3 TaxID=1906741 RepID=UPI00089DE057|nr:MBL fold metallo-hydrolase [Jeongeupia sp. USM3]AOY01919.1 Zn-dependent hydrolase [Jeongeupia sp. USM3]
MNIVQLRNATLVIEAGPHRVLVDPMLARRHALPSLRWLDGQHQRNPVVELPPETDGCLEAVTHCLITHCRKGHFDHLDRAGARWLRERQMPVICSPDDADYLRKRGLNVQALRAQTGAQPFLGGQIRMVPCRHGRGAVGRLMMHGVGYLIEWPGEPSLYLAGDTILTDEVRALVTTRQPDVSVVPAGGARFDLGGEIIMGIAEVTEFSRLARGIVIANHLEALNHCPVKRDDLAHALSCAGVSDRVRIPADGERIVLPGGARTDALHAPRGAALAA